MVTFPAFILTNLTEKSLENILRKGKNDGNQHFLIFPQCVQLSSKEKKCHFGKIEFVVCKHFRKWSSAKFCRLIRVKDEIQNSY